MKDPYVQDNGTLKNKLGIKEYNELNDAERDVGFVKLIDIGETFKQKYDIEYIKAIHRHIFEVYLIGLENLELFQYIKKRLLFRD